MAHRELLDAAMAPFLERLLEKADLQPGQRVLDIGCGTGAGSIAAARAVGAGGHVTGVDIADIMLDAARIRTKDAGLDNVEYLDGDAQTKTFERPFDIALSRFGVMFFDDPVAAFRNIANAVRPGGRLVFLCWGPLAGNPWFAIPRQAAIDVVGAPEPADPRAPGPLAFSDLAYVTGILRNAGLTDISAEEIKVDMTPRGTAQDVAVFASRLGPASRIIAERGGSDADTAKIEAEIARQMASFDTGQGLHVLATLNLVKAVR